MYYVLHNNCEKKYVHWCTGSITSCTGCWCCWYEYYSRDPRSTPLWYSGIRVIILNLKEPIIYWLTCLINKGTLKSFAWTRMQEISIIFSVQIDYFHLYFFQWINFLDFASIKKNIVRMKRFSIKKEDHIILLVIKVLGHRCELGPAYLNRRSHHHMKLTFVFHI